MGLCLSVCTYTMHVCVLHVLCMYLKWWGLYWGGWVPPLMEEDTQLWGQHGVIGLSVCLIVWMAEMSDSTFLTHFNNSNKELKIRQFRFFCGCLFLDEKNRSSQAPCLREAPFWKALFLFEHWTNSFWPPLSVKWIPWDTFFARNWAFHRGTCNGKPSGQAFAPSPPQTGK